MMKETARHKEAFEYYYGLGENRNFKSVESQYKVSNKSVARWSKAFNWQDRIYQRDMEIADKIQKQIVKEMAESRLKELADIRKMKSYPKTLMNTIIDENGRLAIKINNARDLDATMRAWERMIKAELLLAGEATDKTQLDHSGDIGIRLVKEVVHIDEDADEDDTL